MKIICAKNIGFCFGVKRAIDIAENASASRKGRIFTLGPIIHNPQVIKSLESKGINVLKDISKIKTGDVLIIRSHGIPLNLERKLRSKNVKLIDATCPFVKKAQKHVRELSESGHEVVIIGEKKHPEVEGLLSYSEGKVNVVEKLGDIGKLGKSKKVGIVCQTTQSLDKFNEIVKYFKSRKKNIKIFNTICLSTMKRQKEAVSIAKKVELMLIVGGVNSANTARLAKLCGKVNENTFQIETADEITGRMTGNVLKTGIASGASTPDWIIDDIIKKISSA